MTGELVPPPSMMCGECNRVLTPTAQVHTDPGGQQVTFVTNVVYHHPAGYSEDHSPVPVPTVLSQAKEICDFCSDLEVVGYALATPFEIEVIPGVTSRDDGQWSCCSTCRRLLERGDYQLLIDRAAARMAQRLGPVAAGQSRRLHEAFLRCFTGEITDSPQSLD